MPSTFYIIDDDDAVRHMLTVIIQQHIDGAIIHQNDSPWQGIREIERNHPDIVLLDLLMPEMDGLEAARELQKMGFSGRIIMISEVTSKAMIEKAYASGVEYFISKPINVTEVLSIIRRTMENLQLKAYIKTIYEPARQMTQPKVSQLQTPDAIRQVLMDIYKELGISGESGIHELTKAVEIFYGARQSGASTYESLQLLDVYARIQQAQKDGSKDLKGIGVKGVEQRLRRLVGTAMENIAHLGVEDFSHYRFDKYAGLLFHFKSVKQEMDFLRRQGLTRGKIDVRRFIEGLVELIEQKIGV